MIGLIYNLKEDPFGYIKNFSCLRKCKYCDNNSDNTYGNKRKLYESDHYIFFEFICMDCNPRFACQEDWIRKKSVIDKKEE